MKIGMKMTMISVHSSGQPRMKMMNCARIMNWIGVRSIDSTHLLMTSCPPSSANAAEKIDEPTNSQHTIARRLRGQERRVLEDAPEVAHRGASGARPVHAQVIDEAIDDGEKEAAERADGGRFGRRREAEHDRPEHREDQDREREERREQHLEDLEPLPRPDARRVAIAISDAQREHDPEPRRRRQALGVAGFAFVAAPASFAASGDVFARPAVPQRPCPSAPPR